MTNEDIKRAASKVLDSIGGVPMLVFAMVILLSGLVAGYWIIAAQRESIVDFVNMVEQNRNNELMGVIEAIRACQDDLANCVPAASKRQATP